ncbi:MAG TPA: acyl-CoA dehydrogenase [Gammaproteobacteria bacterium]|nr:acyl-CoA dehydrogenase [Gammaproteobacteria bacterium]
MDLEYGPEYNDFRKEVISFVKENENIKLEGPLRSKSRIAWQQKLIDNGYFARSIPKEYGGYGGDMDIIKLRIIAEEFAKSPIPKPMGGQGIQMLVPTLLELGTEEQKQAYVRSTLRGEIVWCQGYSEPNSGSDLASLQTKGELDGDEWIINGQKTWTSTAHLSQMCFILVRTEPDAPKHQGISYLLMPMDTPGIDRRPIKQMTGDSDFNELFLTDVRIPAANIIGKRGEGWKVANATLGHERGSLADPNATMNRFNSLVDLMKDETIDGERIIDKPVFRDRLLKIQGRIIAQQSNALRIVSSQINKNQDTSMAKFITKLQGTELRHDLEGLAIDAMGEIGTLYEDSPHLRDNGAWQMSYMYFLGLIIGGGTSQIQKNIISERGLGMPKEPKVQGA